MGVGFGLEEDKLTAVLVGEIDHHTAASLRDEIDRKAGQVKPKELKLDFSQVTFMDSSGIGLMMGRYRLMESLKGRLTILNLSPQMERIVSLSGISRLVNIEHDCSVEEPEETAPDLETTEEGEEPIKSEENEKTAEEDSSRDIYSHSDRTVNGRKGADAT
ncbi:MAG: anti-sigma factor antagonist [Clostridiales bacterium]|nr:anti-sigma factor antagonist [Clostridiales bacterium]